MDMYMHLVFLICITMARVGILSLTTWKVVRQVHSALENRGNRDAAAPGCSAIVVLFGDNGVKKPIDG